MNDYVRAVGREARDGPRNVLAFVAALLMALGTGWTLVSGRSKGDVWIVLALFVGSSAFVALCVFLIRLDVRRVRAEGQSTPPADE